MTCLARAGKWVGLGLKPLAVPKAETNGEPGSPARAEKASQLRPSDEDRNISRREKCGRWEGTCMRGAELDFFYLSIGYTEVGAGE